MEPRQPPIVPWSPYRYPITPRAASSHPSPALQRPAATPSDNHRHERGHSHPHPLRRLPPPPPPPPRLSRPAREPTPQPDPRIDLQHPDSLQPDNPQPSRHPVVCTYYHESHPEVVRCQPCYYRYCCHHHHVESLPPNTIYRPDSSSPSDNQPATGQSRVGRILSLPPLRPPGGTMPPTNSPPQPGAHPHSHSHQHQHQQQQHQQPPQSQQAHSIMGYGPPPPRPPPLAGGHPSAYPPGRELPALSSITRSSSAGGGSSMSISSMLGGPPSASREPQPPHPPPAPSHYSPHSAPGSTTAPTFAPSPRMHSASSDYPPFRRPQTPEHQRPYDPRADPRGSGAPSPHTHYATTPDVQRYGTPQSFHSRHPSASNDSSRDHGRMAPGPPPQQGAQPKNYGGMPPRSMEPGRGPDMEDVYNRREDISRPPSGTEYKPERISMRAYPYDDRYRAERERQGAMGMEPREREGRERAYSASESGRHHLPPHEQAHRESPRNQPPYGRAPDVHDRRDPRDARWGRPENDPGYRPPPMDHPRQHPDYPPSSGPYPHQAPNYQTAPPPPDRYPPTSHPSAHPPGHSVAHPPTHPPMHPQTGAPAHPYESPDRARLDHPHPQPQQGSLPPRSRPADEAPPPPSAAFSGAAGPSPYDPSRNRNGDDPTGPSIHQRNLLAIQDINRKGRLSPLPQAVQGAQPQQPGPAAEPGIKSEFGRMFAGIGSGVGGVSSPVSSAAMPFTVGGGSKRDDADHVGQDSGPDAGAGAKGAKGRRRKLKEDDNRGGGDDDGAGRLTPVGRANKRNKGQHHHHHHPHHHHHIQQDAANGAAVGIITPFRNIKGVTSNDSPTDKGLAGAHHHHHHHHHIQRPSQLAQSQPGKQAAPSPPVIPPKTKTIISSKAVLEHVAGFPRHHLGDFIYEPQLKAGRLVPNTPTHRGFSSNPKPLPWDRIKGKENCILTVKVPRVHLSPVAREEITARAYLWGTEVYSDDSDVVAACIHGGWIRGEWTEDVDTAMLDLDNQATNEGKRRKGKIQPVIEPAPVESEGPISAPPAAGPMTIPANRDLHINILILPRLSKYSATTRYGITSRQFGGEFSSRHVIHDGLSYMIKSIRWVQNGAQPQARLRGKARRERMREQNAKFVNIAGFEKDQDKDRAITTSATRLGEEVVGNWRKTTSSDETNSRDDRKRGSSEGDKENRPQNDKPSTQSPEIESHSKDNKDVEMGEADGSSKTNNNVEVVGK